MASSSSNAGNATGPSRTTGLNVSNALHARYSSDPTNDNMPGSTRGQYHPRHGLHGATGVPDHYRSISVPSSNDPPQADHFWAPNEDVDAIHAYPDGQLHTTVTPASNTTVNNNWNPAAVPFVTATPHTYPYVNNTDWAQQTIEEFKLYFGNDANDLSAWQRICRHCSVSEGQIPHTVSGCREVSHCFHSSRRSASLLLLYRRCYG